MKLNAGIITSKMKETREFYTNILGLKIVFENDFYLLLTSENGDQISFLLPDHPSQQPIFQSEFTGQGVYLTIEVDNIDQLYEQMQNKKVSIEFELRDEPWGDRHFAIKDPNGIGIDMVKYTPVDS